MVFAVMDVKTKESRPSVGELIVLVSWMLAAMQYQESAKMQRGQQKDRGVKSHVVFPVCHLAHRLLRITIIDTADSCLLFHAASSGSSALWLF